MFESLVEYELYIKPSAESKSEWAKFVDELSESASSIADDIITNTKTVIKDTYDASVKLVDAQYEAWEKSVSSIGEKAFKDSFSDLIDGNPEKIADRWIDSLSDIEDTSRKIFSKTLDDLQAKILEIPGQIASKTFWEPIKDWFTASIIDPLKDFSKSFLKDVANWLGLDSIPDWLGLGDVFGSGGGSGGKALSAIASAADASYGMATGESLLSAAGGVLGAPGIVEAVKTTLGIGSTAAGDAQAAYILANGPQYGAKAIAEAMTEIDAGIAQSFSSVMASETAADAITSTLLAAGPAEEAGWISNAMSEIWGASSASGATTGVVSLAEGIAATQAAEVALASEVAAIYEQIGVTSEVIANVTGGAVATGTEAAASATGIGLSIGPGMATAGIFAAAELFAMAMGEPGPTAILAGAFADAFGMSDKNEMTAEEAQHIVGVQSQGLAEQAAAAASGDWSETVSDGAIDMTKLGGLAFAATQRYGAGNSIASVGGISTDEIEAAVAAMGPYAQALYDVQTITWQVSDAMQAYNDAAERGWVAQGQEAEKLQELAYELGVTEQQYQLMIEAGYSYEQMSAVVSETAGDLRIAMIDVAGAMERAAAEMGLTGEQADIFGSQAAILWEQVQAGTLGVNDFDHSLEDLGMSLGLDETASAQLAARLENMLAASNQAGEGAQVLSNELAALAAQSGTAAANAASVTNNIIDFGNVVGGAADSTLGLIDVVGNASSAASNLGSVLGQTGSNAEEFGQATSEVMSSTFVSWEDGFGQMADSASDLSDEVQGVGRSLASVFGTSSFSGVSNPGNLAFTYHDGGLAGSANWPRFHSGLLPDELPAVLQRGEAIIQRSAVNSETLPVLRSINDTGRTPEPGGGLNVHVEVHGNVLGDGDGMEELARIIDRKLRRINGVRYSM